jgi:hypothetical protein
MPHVAALLPTTCPNGGNKINGLLARCGLHSWRSVVDIVSIQHATASNTTHHNVYLWWKNSPRQRGNVLVLHLTFTICFGFNPILVAYKQYDILPVGNVFDKLSFSVVSAFPVIEPMGLQKGTWAILITTHPYLHWFFRYFKNILNR